VSQNTDVQHRPNRFFSTYIKCYKMQLVLVIVCEMFFYIGYTTRHRHGTVHQYATFTSNPDWEKAKSSSMIRKPIYTLCHGCDHWGKNYPRRPTLTLQVCITVSRVLLSGISEEVPPCKTIFYLFVRLMSVVFAQGHSVSFTKFTVFAHRAKLSVFRQTGY